MKKFLKTAIRAVDEYLYDEYINHRLCAVIVRGGSVLSVGHNKLGFNSFVQHYSGITDKEWIANTHAEQDAVLQARRKVDLRGSCVYVARLTPGGQVGIAKPCPTCEEILRAYGVRKAYYTVSENEYGVLKL